MPNFNAFLLSIVEYDAEIKRVEERLKEEIKKELDGIDNILGSLLDYKCRMMEGRSALMYAFRCLIGDEYDLVNEDGHYKIYKSEVVAQL